MRYCFMDWSPAEDGPGVVPDCPAGVGFVLLADYPGVRWGIFEVAAAETWSPPNPVDGRLATLIASAKRYPPALAVARQEVRLVFGDDRPTRDAFAGAYEVALHTHLSRQHEAPYVLAPALRSDGGHLVEGEWYWILEVSGTPPVVSWVSRDYHVYDNEAGDFDLTGQQLKRLGYSGI